MKVLPQLGVKPSTRLLPARTKCPLCSEPASLRVYEDSIYGGEWYFCERCLAAGDSLQLAARAWQISIKAAAVKLCQTGVLAAVDPSVMRQHEDILRFRKRHEQFWHNACNRLLHGSTGLPKAIHGLGWRTDVPAQRFAAGPGRLFGRGSREEIERLFHPFARSNTATDRVFRGRGWDDVLLVLPLFHLPGQISGYAFIGRDGRLDADVVYRAAAPPHMTGPSRSPTYVYEGGLHGHPDAAAAAARFDNTLVTINDALLATDWQLRNFAGSTQPLPLIAWTDQWGHNGKRRLRTQNAWQRLGDHNVVFWIPDNDAEAWRQAVLRNGRVAGLGVRPDRTDAESLYRYVRRQDPRGLLETIIRKSLPWPQALDQLAAKSRPRELETLLLELLGAGCTTAEIAKRCGPAVRKCFAEMPAMQQEKIGASRGDAVVFEQDDAWFRRDADGRVAQVCGAALRIDHVVHMPRSGKMLFRGRILYENHAVPFSEWQRVVERHTFCWMRKQLLQAQLGYLTFDRHYETDAVEIATQLHKPQFLQGMEKTGWIAAEGKLTWPTFSIYNGGRVETHPEMHAEECPGRLVTPPEKLSACDVQLADAISPAGWTLLAACCSMALSDVLPYAATSVCLTGDGANAVLNDAAAAIDLDRYEPYERRDVTSIAEAQRLHDWPVCILPQGLAAPTRRRWLAATDHNVVTSLTVSDAIACRINHDWLTIDAPTSPELATEGLIAVRRVVVAYLHDLAKRRFRLPAHDDATAALLADMHETLRPVADCPGLAAAVAASKTRLASKPADAFAALLSRGILAGRLNLVQEGFSLLMSRDLIETGNDRIRFDKRLVTAEQNRLKACLINEGRLREALQNADALREETTDHWVISKSWWLQRHARLVSTTPATRLRIVG